MVNNNRLSVISHPNGNGFQMNLKNGIIDVPDDTGCYVVSTGCGSGKTESIKSLIAQKYEEGIIYCVDTKAELMKMYWWILQNICGQSGCTLNRDDVMVLCGKDVGDDEATITEKDRHLNNYRNNPWCMMSKKVLLITHVRFWTGLINFYMIFRPPNVSTIGAFDGDFQKLMSCSNLRKYILFDETPMFIKPFAILPRPMLAGFVEKDSQTGLLQCKSTDDIINIYNSYYRGTFFELFNENNTVNRMKLSVVIGMLPLLFPQWSSFRSDTFPIAFTPSDVIQPQINTHIIVFEGAGDVLFGNSPHFRLLDIKDKYNAHVNFIPFEWGLKRKEHYNTEASFFQAVKNLKEIIVHNPGPTLVVVWRNLDFEKNNTDFVEQIDSILQNDYDLQHKIFSITYFGASDTKSTNDYRDYKNIVLCGTWFIRDIDTKRFQGAFLCNLSNQQHRMWYYIQLISRIGIRNGDGKTYNVYMSNDYETDFVRSLDSYFNANAYLPELFTGSPKTIEWQKRLYEVSMRCNHRREVEILCNKYQELQQMIVNTGIPHTFQLPLIELSQVIPRAKYERGRYDKLVIVFGKLGVNLVIT